MKLTDKQINSLKEYFKDGYYEINLDENVNHEGNYFEVSIDLDDILNGDDDYSFSINEYYYDATDYGYDNLLEFLYYEFDSRSNHFTLDVEDALTSHIIDELR